MTLHMVAYGQGYDTLSKDTGQEAGFKGEITFDSECFHESNPDNGYALGKILFIGAHEVHALEDVTGEIYGVDEDGVRRIYYTYTRVSNSDGRFFVWTKTESPFTWKLYMHLEGTFNVDGKDVHFDTRSTDTGDVEIMYIPQPRPSLPVGSTISELEEIRTMIFAFPPLPSDIYVEYDFMHLEMGMKDPDGIEVKPVDDMWFHHEVKGNEIVIDLEDKETESPYNILTIDLHYMVKDKSHDPWAGESNLIGKGRLHYSYNKE